MEEDSKNSLKDLLGNDVGALPKKPKEPVARPSTSTSEWPSLPASQVIKESSLPASSIQQGQRTPAGPATPVSWSIKKKTPEQYKKDRVGKNAPYFKGTEIVPILELEAEVELMILSYIITDLRTRALA